MIQAYGTSLVEATEKKKEFNDKKSKKEEVSKSDFNDRVNKRRTIVEIMANP
jgi:hypothetical protein